MRGLETEQPLRGAHLRPLATSSPRKTRVGGCVVNSCSWAKNPHPPCRAPSPIASRRAKDIALNPLLLSAGWEKVPEGGMRALSTSHTTQT
jgi:hypothetical protein